MHEFETFPVVFENTHNIFNILQIKTGSPIFKFFLPCYHLGWIPDSFSVNSEQSE